MSCALFDGDGCVVVPQDKSNWKYCNLQFAFIHSVMFMYIKLGYCTEQ